MISEKGLEFLEEELARSIEKEALFKSKFLNIQPHGPAEALALINMGIATGVYQVTKRLQKVLKDSTPNALEFCPLEGLIKLVKIKEPPKETDVLNYEHEVIAQWKMVPETVYAVDTFGFSRYDLGESVPSQSKKT